MSKTLTKLLLLSLFFTPATSHAKAYSKAFLSGYDTVWKGVLISLSKYPLDKNDHDTGEIMTSVIKPGDAFNTYGKTAKSKEFYQLFVHVQKLRYKGRRIIQVKIEKKAFLKGDFINAERSIESDGIEENVILYRIAREVKIEKTVEKLFN